MNTSSPLASKYQPHQEPFGRKTFAAIGLVALLAGPAYLLVVLQHSAHSRMLKAGDSIPAVALRGVDPGIALLSGISGRRAAILFFRVDCPHCEYEIPIFNEAEKLFAAEIQFVAIALSDSQKAQTFVGTNHVEAMVLIDDKGFVGRLFGISELPVLFLVNEDQKIEWAGVGEQSRTGVLHQLSAFTLSQPLKTGDNAKSTKK